MTTSAPFPRTDERIHIDLERVAIIKGRTPTHIPHLSVMK